MSWFPSIEEKTTFCFQVRIKQDASFYGQISPPRAENSDAAVATAGGAAATRNSSNAIRHQGRLVLIFDNIRGVGLQLVEHILLTLKYDFAIADY